MDRREALKAIGMGAVVAGASALAPGAETSALEQAKEGFQNGQFVLPALPYPYEALEPHIDAQTMKLHHDVHHAGYVKGANAALAALKEIREGAREASQIKHWERELAFNASGHVLHSLFWRNLSPRPGPLSPALEKAVEADLGGKEKLKTALSAAANAVEGGGWGILGYHPLTAGLMVIQAEKHQNLAVQGLVPLLVIDVWEHAYYLKYQHRRSAYVEALWNVVNWADVSQRLETAIA